MSFGKPKSNQSSSTSKTSAGLPPNFSSPYGNLIYGKKSGYTYTPIESDAAKGTRTNEENSIYNLTSNIPTNFDVNSYYNNPFYDTTYSLYSQPIKQQQAIDNKELNNRLSASNQLGSSYDAYSRYLQDQNYAQQYGRATDAARLSSADAYNQSLSNQLATLQGLRGDLSAGYDTMYKPLQYALQSQAAYSPYAGSTTQTTTTQPKQSNLLGTALQLGLAFL